MMRIFLFIALLLGAIAENAGAEEAKFTIGLIQSLTGMAAEDGNSVLNAVRLAVEADSKVELLVEDDQSEAKNAVSAYEKLKLAKVDVIIGGTWLVDSWKGVTL